jgi:uncharacterized protein YqfA (UPF0365 family)
MISQIALLGPAMNNLLYIMLALAVLVMIVLFAVITQFLNLWIQAFTSGAYVPLAELIGMRLRKVDPRGIVLSRIRALKGDVSVSISELETHYLAGGHVSEVVTAMIAAKRGDVNLPWSTASAIDLAGYDVRAAAQMAQDDKLSGIDVAWCKDAHVPRT